MTEWKRTEAGHTWAEMQKQGPEDDHACRVVSLMMLPDGNISLALKAEVARMNNGKSLMASRALTKDEAADLARLLTEAVLMAGLE